MNHFEHSMAIRQQIIEDKSLMKILSKHFLNGGKLQKVLGAGSNNIHYRAGKLPGGLWVGTREQFDSPIPYGSSLNGPEMILFGMRKSGLGKPRDLEVFCKEAYCWTEFGGFNKENRSIADFAKNDSIGYVTSFCVGVKFNNPLRSNRTMYAILVEDLTNGGEYNLVIPQETDWVGQLPGKNGLVQIDLDDMPRWRNRHQSIPDYMTDQAVITIE